MKEQAFWPNWSEKVHRFKLTGFVLVLLDGAGPLRYIFSQGLFAFLPFVNPGTTPSWKAFAEMLEDSEDTRLFATYLREEKL